MKVVARIGLGIAAAAVWLFVGCNSTKQQVFSEEELGLRKVDLYSENTVTPDRTEYSKNAPMSGKFISRAFQDAPPMIPHDVDGMLPITVNSNQCITCHMPEVAQSMGATSVPKSHLIDFRPKTGIGKDGRITKNGKSVNNTSSDKLEYITLKEKNQIVGARFNCSQCHAPQSEGQLVDNTFMPEFTSKHGSEKSAWSGSKLTEGLDTLME